MKNWLLGFAAAVALCLVATQATAQGASSEALRFAVEELQVSGRLQLTGADVAGAALLTEFYERRHFEPVWSRPQQAEELLALIVASHADGLDPEDYHRAAVAQSVAALIEARPMSAAERAELDILLTDALVRLGYHQRFGKINPYTLDPQWNFRRQLAVSDPDPMTELQAAIDAPSLRRYMEKLIPRG